MNFSDDELSNAIHIIKHDALQRNGVILLAWCATCQALHPHCFIGHNVIDVPGKSCQTIQCGSCATQVTVNEGIAGVDFQANMTAPTDTEAEIL